MQDSIFKDVTFDDDSRRQIMEGVNILADAVRVTMGPRGQNVVIERVGNFPHVTKDGVTVAKAINLRTKLPNLGVQIVKEAASRTAEDAGDGTTTATILAQSICNEGMKMLASGHTSVQLIKGIEHAADTLVESLKEMAQPIRSDDDIIQIGAISANGDLLIGKMLLEAMNAVGRDGIITVEEAKGFKTSLEVVEGCEINRGYLSPYFVTDESKMVSVLHDPYVLLINKKLASLKEILPLLEKIHEAQKSLLIIADDVDGDALHGLVLNKMQGTLNVVAIRAPEFGEARISALQDLAVLLGGNVISPLESSDLADVALADLGRCKKIMVSKVGTVFVGCAGDSKRVEERLEDIRSLESDPTLVEAEISALMRRKARLSGGVAVIRVGGATDIELKERKDRIDDALNATQAAVQEGILPGGGVALVKASKLLKTKIKSMPNDSFKAGVDVMLSAAEAPLRQICLNAGSFPELILQTLYRKKSSAYLGYDAANDRYVDMLDTGIIDPLKVVRSALENSASVSKMLLSVGCSIVEDDKVPGVEGSSGFIFSD